MFCALVETAASGGFLAACRMEGQDSGEKLRARLFDSEQEARNRAHAGATVRGHAAVHWEHDD